MCAGLLAALLFVCAVCGAGNALPGAVKDALPFGEMLAPLTAQAGSGYAMQEGAAGIAKGDKIYFGTFPSTGYVHVNPKNTSDPYWRVLDNEKDNAGGTNAMFLLSENCWGTGGQYGNVYFDQDGSVNSGQTAPNQWQGSDAQAWCTSFQNAVFFTKEQAAIKGINKSDSVFQHNGSDYFAASSNILNGNKVFFLSGEEACNSAYGFATDKNETGDNSGRVAYYGDASTTRGYWWLRSPYALDTHRAGLVIDDGRVSDILVELELAARPAFNLNLQSVLFSSAAVGGKSPGAGGAGTLNQVSTTSPSEWKLTLLDDGTVSGLGGHIGFSAQCVIGAPGTQSATAATVEQGKQVTLSYSGAKTTENEYVSAILKDSTGNILYYGNLAKTAGGSANSPATGVPLTIPSTVQLGTYTLGVFAEQFNGDKKTDYASKVSNISLTVTAPATAPSITTTTTLPPGRVGAAYTATLSASGTAPFNWSATGLPAGLSIEPSTGVISGTPTESGTFNVSVTATNTAGNDTKTFTLTIDPATAPATAPTVTTTTLPSGRVGAAYTATLSASGTAPFTWSATGLPEGLTFDATTGEISGTPTAEGTFTVSVTATNSAGSDTKQLVLRITPEDAPAPTPKPGSTKINLPHNHQYEWVTLLEADEHNDGEMVYRCRDCGDVLYRVPISAYFIFNKNTMQKILDAPQGASLPVQTRRFISFHKMVMQALADRPDVTLQVSFLDEEYRGNRMSFTIPAGTDALSLLNGEDYCGFLYLGGIFGLHPEEGN